MIFREIYVFFFIVKEIHLFIEKSVRPAYLLSLAFFVRLFPFHRMGKYLKLRKKKRRISHIRSATDSGQTYAV